MKKVNFKICSTFLFFILFTCVNAFCMHNDALARINKNEAKQIALRHAKVATQHATFEKVELDHGKNNDKFEIEFYTHDKEYEYKIRANDGKILEFSQERRDHHRPPQHNGPKISQDEAIRIALRHANVRPNEVTFENIEFDRDRYNSEYEIEFFTNQTEYEYTIDAQSGNVLKVSQEKRDQRRQHPPKR